MELIKYDYYVKVLYRVYLGFGQVWHGGLEWGNEAKFL